MHELSCARIIAKRFVMSGLRISAQFLCKSLCDLYFGTVQPGGAVLRGQGSGNGQSYRQKAKPYVSSMWLILSCLHTFWCRGGGVPYRPSESHGPNPWQDSGRGFSSADYE